MDCFICEKEKDEVYFQVTVDKARESDMLEDLVIFVCKECLKRVMNKYYDTGKIDLLIDKEGQLHFII